MQVVRHYPSIPAGSFPHCCRPTCHSHRIRERVVFLAHFRSGSLTQEGFEVMKTFAAKLVKRFKADAYGRKALRAARHMPRDSSCRTSARRWAPRGRSWTGSGAGHAVRVMPGPRSGRHPGYFGRHGRHLAPFRCDAGGRPRSGAAGAPTTPWFVPAWRGHIPLHMPGRTAPLCNPVRALLPGGAGCRRAVSAPRGAGPPPPTAGTTAPYATPQIGCVSAPQPPVGGRSSSWRRRERSAPGARAHVPDLPTVFRPWLWRRC